MSDLEAAREHLLEVAQAYAEALGESQDDRHYGDHLDYVGDGLALAAREFVNATELQPRDDRPVGWSDKPANECLPVMFTRADLDLLLQIMDGSASCDFREELELRRRLQQERFAFDRHGRTQS